MASQTTVEIPSYIEECFKNLQSYTSLISLTSSYSDFDDLPVKKLLGLDFDLTLFYATPLHLLALAGYNISEATMKDLLLKFPIRRPYLTEFFQQLQKMKTDKFIDYIFVFTASNTNIINIVINAACNLAETPNLIDKIFTAKNLTNGKKDLNTVLSAFNVSYNSIIKIIDDFSDIVTQQYALIHIKPYISKFDTAELINSIPEITNLDIDRASLINKIKDIELSRLEFGRDTNSENDCELLDILNELKYYFGAI